MISKAAGLFGKIFFISSNSAMKKMARFNMDTSNKDNSIEIITTSLIKSLIDDLMKENKNSIQLEYLSELSQNIENINSSNIDIYLKNVNVSYTRFLISSFRFNIAECKSISS